MVAEDYSDSKPAANAIYQVIRDRLLKSPREKLLPLVYAIDSILKNAKGHYTAVVEQDAGNWIPLVYGQLQEPQKAKLEKVWKTWNDARIFSPESLKAMGQCFDENVSGKSLSTSMAPVAGINRTVRTCTMTSVGRKEKMLTNSVSHTYLILLRPVYRKMVL